jgi:hypothetical protein
MGGVLTINFYRVFGFTQRRKGGAKTQREPSFLRLCASFASLREIDLTLKGLRYSKYTFTV